MDIEHYVESYSDYLYHMAYMYTKDRFVAEEIVQDVFIIFYKSRQFEGRASVKTYLTRIVINKSYDYIRKQKIRQLVTLEAFKTTKSAEYKLIQQYEQDEIIASILQLPLKYREVIFLYYYEEMSAVDISATLHITASTVRTRLQRAREKLKVSLQSTEWEVLNHE